jgi:hypothetical protein
MKKIKSIIYFNFRANDLGVDGRMILKQIFSKCDGVTDLMYVGQDSSGSGLL